MNKALAIKDTESIILKSFHKEISFPFKEGEIPMLRQLLSEKIIYKEMNLSS